MNVIYICGHKPTEDDSRKEVDDKDVWRHFLEPTLKRCPIAMDTVTKPDREHPEDRTTRAGSVSSGCTSVFKHEDLLTLGVRCPDCFSRWQIEFDEQWKNGWKFYQTEVLKTMRPDDNAGQRQAVWEKHKKVADGRRDHLSGLAKSMVENHFTFKYHEELEKYQSQELELGRRSMFRTKYRWTTGGQMFFAVSGG
jgi:hypothetical protein